MGTIELIQNLNDKSHQKHTGKELPQNPAYMRRNVGRVIAEKEHVWKTLNESAMHMYPSTTNFLLAKTDIPDLSRKLDDIGIQFLS